MAMTMTPETRALSIAIEQWVNGHSSQSKLLVESLSQMHYLTSN